MDSRPACRRASSPVTPDDHIAGGHLRALRQALTVLVACNLQEARRFDIEGDDLPGPEIARRDHEILHGPGADILDFHGNAEFGTFSVGCRRCASGHARSTKANCATHHRRSWRSAFLNARDTSYSGPKPQMPYWCISRVAGSVAARVVHFILPPPDASEPRRQPPSNRMSLLEIIRLASPGGKARTRRDRSIPPIARLHRRTQPVLSMSSAAILTSKVPFSLR